MPRKTTLIALLLVVSIAGLTSVEPVHGQILLQLWNIDGSSSEREWSFARNSPSEAILFAWIPELDPATTLYFVRAVCDIDNKKAKNKVFFEDVTLTGIDSDNTVAAEKLSGRIKKGEGKPALWDLTPAVASFATDSAVLVGGVFRATKQLKAFQSMTCELSVWELFDIDNLSAGTEAQRLKFFEEVVESGGHPRHFYRARAAEVTRIFHVGALESERGDLPSRACHRAEAECQSEERSSPRRAAAAQPILPGVHSLGYCDLAT